MREMENKYGTIQVVDKYGTLKEVKKYSTLREGDKYATLRDAGKYATVRGGDRYGFQRDPSAERALTKISSLQLQPAQAAAIAAAVSASRQSHAHLSVHGPPQPNGPGPAAAGHPGDCSPSEGDSSLAMAPGTSPVPVQEPERGLSRTNSMQQLEHWVRTQKTRGLDEDTRSVTSYQTLPRNMPSHRALMVPRYPEGYRTLPRNSLARPDSICSAADSLYDQALRPASTSTGIMVERRRSMRDDTMWQLYEWQQRQAFSRQSLALPTAGGHYGTLPSAKTMGNISEHVAHSIPPSPSHGSLALYSTLPPPRQQAPHNPSSSHSEVSSPVFRRETPDPWHRTLPAKHGYTVDRRSIAGGVPPPSITPQSLQGKTPEELTLLLIKLRRQQAELSSLREHTVSQLMALGMEGPNAKRNLIYLDSQTKENEPLIFMIHTMIENSAPRPQLYQQTGNTLTLPALIYLPVSLLEEDMSELLHCPVSDGGSVFQVSPDDDHKEGSFIQRTEEPDIDTKLCRLCEQDKAVRLQEDKLQQLHREKELSEHSGNNGAAQSLLQQRDTLQRDTLQSGLLQQRDTLQSGLLSTCRELSRVTTELERSWGEYERLGADVTLAKSTLLEQLEALGSPQELWRIQDVMEALAKNKPQRSTDNTGVPASRPLSSLQKNEGLMQADITDTENDPNSTALQHPSAVCLGPCVWFPVFGTLCLGPCVFGSLCVWVPVFGSLCLGPCVWVPVSGSLCLGPCVSGSLCVWVPVFGSLCLGPCVSGSLCLGPCVSGSLCVWVLCLGPCVSGSLCVWVPVCLGPCVSGSLCLGPCVSGSLCVWVPVCLGPCVSGSLCVWVPVFGPLCLGPCVSAPADTLLPLSPLKEADSVPPRPPLPQYYDSAERPPNMPPHHSHPGGRLQPQTHRPEDRKAGSRSGVHSVRTAEILHAPPPVCPHRPQTVSTIISTQLSQSMLHPVITVAPPPFTIIFRPPTWVTPPAVFIGLHKQNPDYRLYKSEPELTTVKEELDEANGEDKDKAESSDTASKVSPTAPSCPVGIIPPRTKSPVSPLESSTIASYVTLRKTKKPESRS
ncbi:Pleckstrin like domain containing family A member 5, partial [Dissostichus eleginoides]